MTALYDPYWSETEQITLPICLFQTTNFSETWSNEISRKRVILYEEPQTMVQKGEAMRRGVMESAVDNIVKNPKTYNVEAIVPFLPVGRYVSSGVRGITDTITTVAELMSNGDGGARDGIVETTEAIMGLAGGILKAGTEVAALIDQFSGTGSAATLNKNSLEAMADSGRVLCMKTWGGYSYKYVVITGLTIQKKPLEDDVFRASMQLQELLVISITEPTDLKAKQPMWNEGEKTVLSAYGLLSIPLVGITRVEDAEAGGPLVSPKSGVKIG
jgi:hypothetical protein